MKQSSTSAALAAETLIERREATAEAVAEASAGRFLFLGKQSLSVPSGNPKIRVAAVVTDEFCNPLGAYQAAGPTSYSRQERYFLDWARTQGPVLGVFTWRGSLLRQAREQGGPLGDLLHNLQEDYRNLRGMDGRLTLSRALAISHVFHDQLLLDDPLYGALMLAELARKTGLAAAWLDKQGGPPILFVETGVGEGVEVDRHG